MRELTALFPDATIERFGTHNKPSIANLARIVRSDLVIVGGSNLLCENFRLFKQWRLDFWQAVLVRRAIFFGVGSWQYGERAEKSAVRFFRAALSKSGPHSVRDQYTKTRLAAMGFANAINTHCPTMWPLIGKDAGFYQSRQRAVLTTLTDYNRSPKDDDNLRTLLEHYDTVYFWPQGVGDLGYLRTLDCFRNHGNKFVILDRSIESLNDRLDAGSIDYLGTRLHCGIKCLTKGVRSMILAVDNRATELSHDTGLPIANREDAVSSITKWIENDAKPSIQIDRENVQRWREAILQFAGRSLI